MCLAGTTMWKVFVNVFYLKRSMSYVTIIKEKKEIEKEQNFILEALSVDVYQKHNNIFNQPILTETLLENNE
jgi:hypothetical protein